MRKKFKIILSAFLLMWILITNVYAQKVASTSMQFLKVMPCARATAMGDAYNVLASGAEAVFWNPSGVALAQNIELSSTFINWIFDTRQYALSFVKPLGDFGSMGLQLQYVDYGTFDEAVVVRPYIKNPQEPGLTGRQFKPYVYLVGVTYAKSLTDRFAVGLSFKYAHESLFDKKTVVTYDGANVNTYANAYLFDLGIRYDTHFRTIQIAASIQNFGPSFKYAVENEHAPLQFRVGVSADLIGPNSLLYALDDNRIGFAMDVFQPNDYSQQLHAGFEYEYAKTIALRMGYKYNYDSEGLTFGGGVKTNLGFMRLSLDYSYGVTGEYIVGNIHRISLGVELQ